MKYFITVVKLISAVTMVFQAIGILISKDLQNILHVADKMAKVIELVMVLIA